MKWYHKSMKHKGFTIVELLVVIAVIGILASIAIVGYVWMRGDAMDSKIKSAVKTVGDAIQLYESQENKLPSGTGRFNVPNGVDSLVPKYLKYGYRNGITSKTVTDVSEIFFWDKCNDGGRGFVVYAILNNPSTDDQGNFIRVRSVCGHNPSVISNKYNYAQIF